MEKQKSVHESMMNCLQTSSQTTVTREVVFATQQADFRKLEFQLEALKDQQSNRESELQHLLDSAQKECLQVKAEMLQLQVEKRELSSLLEAEKQASE